MAVKVALKFAPNVTVTVQYASVMPDVRTVACVWNVQRAQQATVKNVIFVANAQQCVPTVVKPAKVVQKSAPNVKNVPTVSATMNFVWAAESAVPAPSFAIAARAVTSVQPFVKGAARYVPLVNRRLCVKAAD